MMQQIQSEPKDQLNSSIENGRNIEHINQSREKKNEGNINQGWSPISSVIIDNPKQGDKSDRSNNKQYIEHMNDLIAMDQNQFKQSKVNTLNIVNS